jgi:hypothetical protein
LIGQAGDKALRAFKARVSTKVKKRTKSTGRGTGTSSRRLPMTRFAIIASALIVGSAATAYIASAEPSTVSPSARAQDPQDRITCRRFTRVGSLVDGYRVCKTNREWQREHDNVRQLGVSDSCGTRGEGGAGCNQ